MCTAGGQDEGVSKSAGRGPEGGLDEKWVVEVGSEWDKPGCMGSAGTNGGGVGCQVKGRGMLSTCDRGRVGLCFVFIFFFFGGAPVLGQR